MQITWEKVFTSTADSFIAKGVGVVNVGGTRLVAYRAVSAEQANIYRSADNGNTWVLVKEGFGFQTAGIARGPLLSPAPDIVLLGFDGLFTGTWRIRRSVDAGDTWTDEFTGATGTVDRVFTGAKGGSGRYLFGGQLIGSNQAGAIYSDDNGDTWSSVVSVSPGNNMVRGLGGIGGSTLVAGFNFTQTSTNQYGRSTDNGATWTLSTQQLPGPNYAGSVAINLEAVVSMGGSLVLMCGDGGVTSPDIWLWRSTDGGVTWSRVATGGIVGYTPGVGGCCSLFYYGAGAVLAHTYGLSVPFRLSTDFGVTFPIQTIVKTGHSLDNSLKFYQMAKTDDGHIIAVAKYDSGATFEIWLGVVTDPPSQRHYNDQIALSLFDAEVNYDAGPAAWANANAVSMTDFDDDSPHEEWDDLVEDDADLSHGYEYRTVQEIVRQSVRWTYTEPRTKPNSLAGLLGLALGTVASTKDGAFNAWRHKLTPASPIILPSIGAQIAHQNSSQYEYKGVKADGFILRRNGAYLTLESPLIGSGTRAASSTTFPASVTESWLHWGDCNLWLKDTGGTVITIPTTPTQGSTNLGAGAVNLSKRIRTFAIDHPNNLLDQMGYRPSTGKVRGHLHTAKRSTTLRLGFDVMTDREAEELDWYLSQRKLAFELNCDSGTVVVAGSAFKFGCILLIPMLQIRRIPRSEEDEFDILTLEGTVMDDKTNSVMMAFVYNGQSTYLA